MWESKEQAIDVNFNSDELWFVGVYGQAVAKPTEIRKWEENSKFFKLLDKSYPRIKADRMLKDLSLIALAYSMLAVQQRLTFKPNPKGENSAPVAFQHDPNGELLEFVLDLRSLTPSPSPPLYLPSKRRKLRTPVPEKPPRLLKLKQRQTGLSGSKQT
jgi:hypothetical protein